MKNTLRNIFLAVGFGTLIFTPMIIFDNGIDDTMRSVIIWLAASVLYGVSFSILKMKTIFRYPLHIIACFVITLAVRTGYSYFMNGEIHFKKLFLVTLPIFVVIYVLLFLFMKYLGSPDTKEDTEE